MSAGLLRRPFLKILQIGAALLLVAGLFLLGVALTPPVPPAQAVYLQPLASTPVGQQPAVVGGGGGFSGTLASFTALIPEIIFVSLPLIAK